MPIVRKLAADEVQQIQDKGKGKHKLTAEQYDRFLSEYRPGEYGEAVLEENEKRLTVRNRLQAAARRRGHTLQFIRTSGNSTRFKVVSSADPENQAQGSEDTPSHRADEAAARSDELPAPPKRRGGRPRKTT